ncbi:uncharacterized protein LOC111715716 [Eurytemora carolleeae]|uniref:uncharacterized protein LOC111715716 n=1 Tax=Eurytemora carolleeae TaxID=1294199 RepID=UPI000C77CD47|nr:uncharacterized protein LOC111715716 [Eurytemora carolleeae]XP_023346849.1 uncharacterized protein LOC111715716 [Eurytemora carolleeae]|eukprot:XP_023346848.1 uncharacterized protein LOC111715716 [Eurytemora affinis]
MLLLEKRSILFLLLISQCWGEMEKKRSYTFGPREVSQEFWKTRSVVGTQRFRSPVECASSLRLGSLYNSFLYREDGLCEMAYADNLTPSSPSPVKVKHRVLIKEGDKELSDICPTTHPYPFLEGRKCCQKNLENPFVGVTTGTRGLLTINSTSCSYPSVECEVGYKCSLNSIIGNPMHMNVDLQPGSNWYVTTVSNEDECQQLCEKETKCKGWVWSGYCYMFQNGVTIKEVKESLLGGFKSSYINMLFD